MDPELEDLKGMRRRRGSEEPKMDITPMIDVTFLLLIFFIVASRLDPQMVVDLAKAKHGGAIPEKSSAVLVVTQDNPDNPSIFKGASKEVANQIVGTPEEQEEQIRAFVDEECNGGPAKRYVLIKAERGVKYRHMDRIYKAVKQGITDQEIHVAVIEKR
jgi:biopolymer transport protein ExbD